MAELDYGIDLAVDQPLRASAAIDLVRTVAVGPDGGSVHDLERRRGRDVLAQAIRLRLATARGELAHLGHPRFGSRLHLLIGRLDSRATRSLAEAYVREALREEPRIDRLSQLTARTDPTRPGVLLIDLAVLPVGDQEALALMLRLDLDAGGPA